MSNLITPEQILSDLIKDRNKDPGHTQELITGYAQVMRDWCRGVIGSDDRDYSNDNADEQSLTMLVACSSACNHLRAEQRERAGIEK